MQVVPAITIVILAVTALISAYWVLRRSNRKKTPSKIESPHRRRNSIIAEANRRFEANPKDPIALESLAMLHYREGNFTKAMRAYQNLLNYASTDPNLDEAELNLRYGLSAIHSNFLSEARLALMTAQARYPNNFEIKSGLGKLEYAEKEYANAVGHLQQALQLHPKHGESAKYLGLALFQLKEYSKSIEHLELASDTSPKDVETLYTLARSLYEVSNYSEALGIFNHLKGDPKWRPSSYLYSGLIHERSRNWNDAISDYQAAINRGKVQSEIVLEAKYRLAEIFNQTHQFSRALSLLSEINEIFPEYRDIANRMKHYRESNDSLQIYLTAPQEKFTSLCKSLTRAAYTGAKVTIAKVDVSQNQYTDILAKVKIAHGANLTIFRYMKTSDEVGTSCLQSLYARSKNACAGRCLCFSPGIYSKEAEHFVKIRPIKLIDKQKLTKYLETINLNYIQAM